MPQIICARFFGATFPTEVPEICRCRGTLTHSNHLRESMNPMNLESQHGETQQDRATAFELLGTRPHTAAFSIASHSPSLVSCSSVRLIGKALPRRSVGCTKCKSNLSHYCSVCGDTDSTQFSVNCHTLHRSDAPPQLGLVRPKGCVAGRSSSGDGFSAPNRQCTRCRTPSVLVALEIGMCFRNCLHTLTLANYWSGSLLSLTT